MGDSAAEEFESWVPWPEAYRLIGNAIGYGEARTEICRRLSLDSLRACAREAHWEYDDRPGFEKREFEILGYLVWKSFPPPNTANVWSTGSYDFKIKDKGRYLSTMCQGLRLDPDGVNTILSDAGKAPISKTPSSEPIAITPKHAGGRPPKPFWEEMWVEIARQLYAGDLQPTKQAHIEKAMADWLALNGYDAGPTQIRDRARKLWQVVGN